MMASNTHAAINYVAKMSVRPRYYANNHANDVIDIEPVTMQISDGRQSNPMLDREGFALVPHISKVTDFADRAQVATIHPQEIIDLIKHLTGADAVTVSSPGVLRFAERSDLSGQLNNSRPARFAHVDISDATAAAFSERSKPEGFGTPSRVVHYNIWRAISPAPQDVPLALCDARSVSPADLTEADAVFDEAGKPEWSFVGLVVNPNQNHAWHWFPNMNRDEAIVFVTNDSAREQPHNVPHVAFDNPLCPANTPPRASIEMRAIAYFR